MKKMKIRFLSLLLTLLMLFCASPVSAERENISFEGVYYGHLLEQMIENYKFDADTMQILQAVADKVLSEHPELLEDLIDVTADQFDQHTDYLTKEELAQFEQNFNVAYVGIGVMVQRTLGAVQINSVFLGGPAQEAGIQAGDLILKIEGQDVTGYAVGELTTLIKGPEGTRVNLTLKRGEEILTVSVERRSVEGDSVAYSILEDGIGYLAISIFNNNTPSEIGRADRYFKDNGIKKLIIDLRDNSGGNVISVVESLGYFVPQGKTVMSVEYKDATRNYSLRSVGNVITPYYEIVALMNESSASGAELFAGNIRDHKLGTLVGVSTFGKGTMQSFSSLVPFQGFEPGQVKITIGEYLLPSGARVTEEGIAPDIRVANSSFGVDTSVYAPMEYRGIYRQGDEGTGVLAIKQRLDVLNFLITEPDEVYDSELTVSVRAFQREAGLPVTGEMDIETQIYLGNVVEEVKLIKDKQLDKAISLLQAK